MEWDVKKVDVDRFDDNAKGKARHSRTHFKCDGRPCGPSGGLEQTFDAESDKEMKQLNEACVLIPSLIVPLSAPFHVLTGPVRLFVRKSHRLCSGARSPCFVTNARDTPRWKAKVDLAHKLLADASSHARDAHIAKANVRGSGDMIHEFVAPTALCNPSDEAHV